MIATPTLNPEATGLLGIGILDMDVRFHGFVWTGLEGCDEVGLVLMAEIFENEMEADVAPWLTFMGPVAIGDIESWVWLFMSSEKRTERIDHCAFSHIIGPDEHIQSRLKFQLGVT